MMGELARRYPPQSLVISTGAEAAGRESDAAFAQPVDRAAVRATRLRTINGLVLWTWRAGALARRWRPGFAWCGELKPAGYPAWWLRRRHGIPYGVVVHGTELLLLEAKIGRSRFKRWTASALLRDAAVLVANSAWTADLARSVYGQLGRPDLAARVEVVPLGTEPSHFRPGIDATAVRRRYGLVAGEGAGGGEGRGPWLLTVARLEWHKGIDMTIRALPAVRAAVPEARYAVAGVGPRRPQLEALIAELRLGDAVRLLGPVPDTDLPALYNAADLYVGASRRHDLLVEGFGISLVEASASGLAVVAGRSGGVPEAVRDGATGILVDSGAPEPVAEGIIALLRNGERRRAMGAAGRHAVETYYNWDRVARDFIRIDAAFRRPPPPAAR
jgi:phosphatidylinositol alpha-1,6-mannosyltransferase